LNCLDKLASFFQNYPDMKPRIPSVLITFALVCFALLPKVQAFVPPPDGGYPNFTTAEGTKALFSLTTGSANTAVGWFSLFSNTEGSFNTAAGAGALLFNTSDENTAFGTAALLFNITGTGNTASGALSLFNNTIGVGNTANGGSALYNNTIGTSNTASGINALFHNTTGSFNTSIGTAALLSNTTGSSNIALGASAGNGISSASNVICIGANVFGADVGNTTWIANVYGVTTQSGTTAPVVVSDGGRLGTVASSERFKKDIVAMEKASEVILSLRPVTFHYKTDTEGRPQFGLIAEEVAKVNPALVLPDKEGKPYTVRYDAVNAMLLNEFLKEHLTVQELKSVVAKQEAVATQQQKQIEALTAGLQKVSTQLELNKLAPQTVLNNQ
jgi:hypothetical protein